MPSRSANSIHVARMCEALIHLNHDVTLFAKRSYRETSGLQQTIERYYGVDLNKIQIVSFISKINRANNFRIAIMALLTFLKEPKPDVVISRNLHASYLLSLFYPHQHILHEVHELQPGLYKYMLGQIMQKSNVSIILISNALFNLLLEYYGFSPKTVLTLHDAAPNGIKIKNQNEKRAILKNFEDKINLSQYKFFAGYFGHLHLGRGIDTIHYLAERFQDIGFLVFGGNEKDIVALNKTKSSVNFHVMGYLQPSKAIEIMGAMDFLLMPYKKRVSIGLKNHDTGPWMSPMKMFEYMATGVPIISSDLPVLREVLQHNENCLLADHDNPESWSQSLIFLIDHPEMAKAIGIKAHKDTMKKYTWCKRAQTMLQSIRNEN